MKKLGIGKRLLSGLLALIMVLSLLPLSVFAAMGDLRDGETGLDANIDTKDTISWPIKIYDYLNDGLLFEYASAQDASLTNLGGDAYGGGVRMPGDISYQGEILGSDFTVNSSESGEYYDGECYDHWLYAKSNYNVSYAQQGSGTAGAFKFLRLKPWLTTSNMPDIVISDFTNDQYYYLDGTTTYPRDRVRYAVVVYKTGTSGLQLTLGLSTNRTGSKTIRDYNNSYATGPNGYYVDYDVFATQSLQVSDTWNYFVVDMKSGTNATVWNEITKVYQVTLGTNMTNSSQDLDLSHIAYFSDAEEAVRFGEAAKAFSNNPGEYLPDQYYTVNGTTYSKHWNMGNNTAFTMLYSSSGGGWQNSYTGGENSWENGYFSYQIGKHTGTSSWANGINSYRSDAKSKGYVVSDDIFLYSVSANSSHDLSQYDFGYTLYNEITAKEFAQVMTAGLLQNDLISVKGVDGKTYRIPEYKQDSVEYIAKVLEQTLVIGRQDRYGNYNYNFVQGSVSSQFADANGNKRDLASALREALALTAPSGGLGNYGIPSAAKAGSYATTKAKQEKLIGPYAKVKGNIKTFYDAAFYLMHNLFVDDSYNQLQHDYNYLVLSKAPVSGTGKEAYVFDAGFTTGNIESDPGSTSAVVYNKTNGTASLSSAVGKDEINYGGDQWTTRNPFLPVTDAQGDYGCTGTPYFREDGARIYADYGNTYVNRNYNYVMQANAEFVYHYQDDLFFQFEGDDDVYLFVNGELVLDIGAAHSITSVKMQMNDYVLRAQKEMSFLKQNYGYRPDVSDEKFEKILDEAVKNGAMQASQKDYYRRWHRLNLIDGENYTIDFYYMERHGWGANMRVATNILMTDPAMITEKKAYQDGAQINYGGIVVANKEGEIDTKKNIEYSFSVTNEGENKLYNLTFNDYDIGLTLSPKTGLTFHRENINGVNVFDARGQTLEPSDLFIHVEGYLDEAKTRPVSKDIRFDSMDTNGELKQFLTNLAQFNQSGEDANNKLFSGDGLWRHATVTIRGIYYRMTKEQVAAEEFNNIVFTTANPAVDSELVLNSADTHQVRLIGNAKHIYQWASDLEAEEYHEVYFNRADLVKWLEDPTTGTVTIGARTYAASQLSMTTCRKDGTTYDFPDIIVRDNNTSMAVNYLKSGTQLFFIKLFRDSNGDGEPDDLNSDRKVDENDYRIVPLAVHVTDVNDDAVVLDYGLKAELTGKNGITTNDYITVPNLNTGYSIMGMSTGEPSYLNDFANASKHNYNRISFLPVNGRTLDCIDGVYEYTVDTADDKLYFTPRQFMDNAYSIYIAVTIHELDVAASIVGPANGATVNRSIDITKEVQMYQKVTVLPASVMYYENDFAGIKFESGNETFVTGTGSSILQQGVDQSVNYGADQDYQTKENAQISGNSMSAIKVTKYGKLASFNFTGTGFEILSRTNAFDSASFVISVKKDGTVIRTLPVITEFSNASDSACDHADQTGKLTTPVDGSTLYNGTRWRADTRVKPQNRRTFYFDNTQRQWGSIYAYTLDVNGAATVKWPGFEMACYSGNIYSLSLEAGNARVVLHNGKGQTAELTLPEGEFNLFDGTDWVKDERVQKWGKRAFYFDNSTYEWENVYVSAYGANGLLSGNMLGTITAKDENIYSVVLPEDAIKVVIHNGNGHSAELNLPADGSNLYDGSDWWDYNAKSGKKYRVFSFDKTKTDWESVYAYAYGTSGIFTASWPGTALKDTDDHILSIRLPEGATNIIFNNGVDKMAELPLSCDTTNLFDGTRWWGYDAASGLKNRVISYNNSVTKWEKVYAHLYGESGELNGRMPGTPMQHTGDDIYALWISDDVTAVNFNGTNHNENGHCTACGTYVGHMYYKDECSAPDCDQRRLDYYLVGYINGADYGCEGDHQNMGQYKFVNGKLTATFKTDGYVFVKTTGNAGYYMTNGYPGAGVTSTYLYNTNSQGLKADKLHVPGGVELTFTLVENNDGTLTLSFTTSNDDVTDEDKTVYFNNTDGWAQVNAYYWSITDATMINWPGVTMTRTEAEDPIYVMKLPSDAEYVIFNDGSGAQTMDLTVPADNMLYSFSGFNKGWSVYNPDKTTLNFDNSVAKWAKVNIYYWSDQDDQMVQWPGEEMTAGANNIFTSVIPSNATCVIFNNGKGAQTGDLTILKNGDTYLYGTEGSSWASQSVTDEFRSVYFKNTAQWTNLHVHYWDAVKDIELSAWPGDAMVLQEGDVYKAVIPVSATHVRFNNGDNGLATTNIKLTEDENLFVYDQTAADTQPTGSWTTYGSSGLVPTRTVYLLNGGNWATPYAHYWVEGGAETVWPGVKMTYVTGNLYSVQVPVDTEYIIFNSNTGTQTDDLPLFEEYDTYDYSNKVWVGTGSLTRTIYLQNNTGWADPYAYYWNKDSERMPWPGVKMTHIGTNRYSITIPFNMTKIIFSNNGAPQTADLKLRGMKDLYDLSANVWLSTDTSEETPIDRPIYYENTLEWDKVSVYYWSDTDNQMTEWPGVEMTADENGIFTYMLPGNATKVIFNDGVPDSGNKTGDLTIPGSGANFYSCPAPNCGSWESYEAMRVVYFDMGSAGWGTPHAYYWSYADQGMVSWPGAPMTHVSGTRYSITVPARAEMISFTNGLLDFENQKTADLTLTNAYDQYSYDTGAWTRVTRTIYYEGSGSNNVWVTYSGDNVSLSERVMIRVRDNIFSCVIPMGTKYVTFEDNGKIVAKDVILSDDHDFYTTDGWSEFDPSAAYREVVYFKNNQGWPDTFVYFWGEGVNKPVWPGIPMTFVDEGLYMANIPSNVVNLQFNNGKAGELEQKKTKDLILPNDVNEFIMNASGNDGRWSVYTKPKSDAIHQVPAIRVDGLELGNYEVEILGMPTYRDDVDWTHMQDFVKDTYFYFDGVRVYQPLGSTNEHYSVTENGATFEELRNLILNGNAAVAIYEYGTTAYTGNFSWTENRNGIGSDMETKYVGNQLTGINDYLLLGPNNETYLNGNAQTQAVIFYVKETDAAYHALQIAARGIDEGLFLGRNSTGVNATLYHGVCIEKPDGTVGYGWRPIDTILSGTEQYYTVDYQDCPYLFDENGTKIYQVALFVRSGMVSFTNVKFIGLDLQSNPVGEATDLKLNNGMLYAEDMESLKIGGNFTEKTQILSNLVFISSQMDAIQWIEEEKQQSIVLKYPALSFEDEVYYNVFFSTEGLTEQPVEMGLLMFDTLEENGTIFDADAVISGVTASNGLYVARSAGVQAKDLGKTMYFRVFAQMPNGAYVYSKAASYSARQYAKSVLTGNYSVETKALIASMLKYSEAARSYFGGMETLGDLITEEVDALTIGYRSDLLSNAVKADASKSGYFAATSTGFSGKAPAVSFDGAFSINYFFTPSTTVQGNMTLYYWNAKDYEAAEVLSAENATGSVIMTPGDRYSAAITGISAKDMDTTYYVAAVYQCNGQTYCSGVLAYSLASYCNSKATAAGSISDLAKATAVYGYHAKQLFG